jgi:Bacterial mobilisation protein (MobC)
MPYRKLAVRLPKQLADRFEGLMRSRGQRSAAGALRSLIDAELKGLGAAAQVPAVPARPSAKGRTRRLWVHVTKEEADEIHALAQPFGGHTAWFRGVLDARMGRATELPARPELEALHEASVQLGRLATNLNQIARALNTARLAGEPVAAEAVRLDHLADLKRATGEVTRRTDAVILAARRRVFNE